MVGWHHQLDGHEFKNNSEVGMDRDAWCAVVYGMQSQTQLSD